jgi:two-component system response regulator RegX3
MPEKILVIEDDKSIADSVTYTLRQEGFEVEVAYDGVSGLDAFRNFRPDLVILDLLLPGLHGFDVFRAIRRQANTPVIMLTAKAEESDCVAGIELGADDYVVKPFSMRVLVARIRMVLRRARAAAELTDEVLDLGEVVIDRTRHIVTVRGEEVSLTAKEFALLEYLARNRGRVLTRAIILENVWGGSHFIDEHTVDVHIRWLRQKIEERPSEPKLILTVRGVGYKLNA